MDEENLNYFVCTLGQAAVWNEKHPHAFGNINDLIDERAQENSNAPAVGFASPEGKAALQGPWEKGYSRYLEVNMRVN